MADLISPATISPGFLKPAVVNPLAGKPATPPTAGAANVASDAFRAKAKDAANKFESQFLSQMIGQMFEGVKTDGPFGGGFGEQMFRSMMTDAMAKQMTQTGGVGVSDVVQREILKMQGLT